MNRTNGRGWCLIPLLFLVAAPTLAGAADRVPLTFVEHGCRVPAADRNEIQGVVDFERSFYDVALGSVDDDHLTIHVFGRFEDYRSYLQALDRKYKIAAGAYSVSNPGRFYSGAGLREAVILQDGAYRATICHEVSHYLLSNRLPQPPMWLNEGLAVYFGQARMAGGRLIVHDARCPGCGRLHGWESLNAWLDQDALVTLPFLLDLDRRGWLLARGRACELYTHAWSLIHYFMNSRAGIQRLVEIMRDLEAGATSRAAVEQTYPGGVRRLEADWHAYIRAALDRPE